MTEMAWIEVVDTKRMKPAILSEFSPFRETGVKVLHRYSIAWNYRTTMPSSGVARNRA